MLSSGANRKLVPLDAMESKEMTGGGIFSQLASTGIYLFFLLFICRLNQGSLPKLLFSMAFFSEISSNLGFWG